MMIKLSKRCLAALVVVTLVVGVLLHPRVEAEDQEENVETESPSNLKAAQVACPTNLSFLQADMDKALRYVKSASFRNVMLASLQASIPEAIVLADGLPRQIAFLKSEIIRQEQERIHAEKVAREGLPDSTLPLKPCRRGQKSSYCEAIDQYLTSTAANLANHAFLDALLCYQREGM